MSPRPTKKPRRTAERILDTTLALYNRFGEPNVSTTLISAELGISPGNLYYHYPSKDALINALFERYRGEIEPLLAAAGDVASVDDAWLWLHMLFELIWRHRYLYRDTNDLLSKNRHLEVAYQEVLALKGRAMQDLLSSLSARGLAQIERHEAPRLATTLVVVLNYWLSYEYVRDPRHALEPERAHESLLRGAFHTLCLLTPYLRPEVRAHLTNLGGSYQRD
jgi:AcrR family transcriptional regulator